MKIRKEISLVLGGTMCAMLLGACGQSATAVTESAASTETVQASPAQEEVATTAETLPETSPKTSPKTTTDDQPADAEKAAGEIGKVTAVDGDAITLVMANMPDGQGAMLDGESPTDMEKPADGEAPTDMEKPADGEAPTDMEKPTDGGKDGNMAMQFNGDEQTITVTTATVITKDGETATATIDDITVDSILRIVTDATSGEVTQLVIMNQ